MSRSGSKSFRDIKTSFETRSKPTTAATSATQHDYRSSASTSTNMSSNQPTRAVPTIAQTIDSVLNTSTVKPASRPLAKLRPSWIGPPRAERPISPGPPAMKQHVIVEYSSPGLKPPVYIFTSLSDPQWDAVEMQPVTKDHVEYKFYKTFDVEEGEYQYKFRLGPGDWWACDESKPLVDDGQGNKNNSLVVRSEPSKPIQPDLPVAESKIADQKPKETQQAPSITADSNDKSAPPLMKHEVFVPNEGSELQQTPEREVQDPMASEESKNDMDSSVLMKHELPMSTAPKSSKPTSHIDHKDASLEDDEDIDESNRSPLLRHESVAPSSREQEHAPLFRHESIAMGYNHHESPAATMSPVRLSRKTSSAASVPDEANPHDPSLEKFPTDHAGIIEKFHQTSKTLAADETVHETEHGSPHSQAMSETSVSVPSLPSVREAEEEELDRIREAENETYEKEKASGDEMDPLRPAAPITPPLTPKEPEDDDFEPRAPTTEVIEIDKTVIIEVVEERKGLWETLVDRLGGNGNTVAIAVGMLVLAAGLATMQFL